MADALTILRAIAETLDGLDIAACVFDEADGALLWNRAFLSVFPEHAGQVYVGEPYQANLRRFYEGRLDATEMPRIGRYIEEGVARHRLQQRPYTFEHHSARLTVASQALPGIGRIRIWKESARHEANAEGLQYASIQTMFRDGMTLFNHVADGVMVSDATEHIAWVNQPFVVMYKLKDRSAAKGIDFEHVYRTAWHGREAEDPGLFTRGLSTLAENMRFSGSPFEVPLPDDRWTRVIEQRDPGGQGFCVHVDITTLKRQQQALVLAESRARESEALVREKSALLEATLARMDQGIMMVSAKRVVEVCNRRAIELLDLPAELMATKPTFESVLAYQWSTDEFRHTQPDIQDFVRAGGILDRPHCYDRKRPNGRVIEVHSMPVDGGGVLRTYTDITDRKRSEEHIRHAARHDGLTALVNRETFLESLALAIESSTLSSGGFAVHYIDLDGFKPINDQFGHAVGDKVLALAADRMRNIARDADVVARMGGDEFAVLQYGVEAADRGLGLARRILESIAQPIEIESHIVCIGASIGIAIFPAAGGDPDLLLRNADAAMYAAKASGGQCARFFDDHLGVTPVP